MTPEELMKPRYKVIADYPNSIHKIGDIIQNIGEVTVDRTAYYECAKHPHLFKPLAWYEEREASEMPEYMKDKDGIIRKVLSWSDKGFVYEKKSTNPIILPNVTVSMSVIHCYSPATESEYLNYKNS